jgi:rhodanese-related sulfurtransferase
MMIKTITREQIKEKLDIKEPMIIIEALPQKYFDRGHLPGALNIPHDEIQTHAPDILPNKDACIVVYCASIDCQNSKIAANTLQQMGYTNALEYVEGKQHWLEANFPIELAN